MNIVLLGNGFDLHYNLPTTYTNFLNTIDCLLNPRQSQHSTVGDIFGAIHAAGNDKRISESYTKYQKNYDSCALPFDRIETFIEIASKNPWVKYFKGRKKDGGWIDFEREIRNVLATLEYVFSVLFTEDSYGFASLNPKLHTIPLQLAADTRDIISTFALGKGFKEGTVLSEDDETNGLIIDFEDSGYDGGCFINSQYCIRHPENHNLIGLNIEAIVSSILMALQEFSKLLSDYLNMFVEEPLKLCPSLATADELFKSRVNVVTLNYTNTFEILYKDNKAADVHHLHGTTNGQIVLGVNSDSIDEKQEKTAKETRFLAFKKYYQRVVYQTDIGYMKFIRYINNQREINIKVSAYQINPIRLFVFGHSLDSTDKDIIKELFSIADKIVIFYPNEKELGRYVNRLVGIYTKTEFDLIRLKKQLTFLPTNQLGQYEELIS